MPDSFDYEWLSELIARPETWTGDELATVQLMLENQRQSMTDLHPKDVNGMRSYQAVIDEMEAALQAYLGTHDKRQV